MQDSIYYYNDECSIYREHMVTIHERMHHLDNKFNYILLLLLYIIYYIYYYYILHIYIYII
jgi:hypothetical protein